MLGFNGTDHQTVPDDWLSQIGNELIVFGQPHYFQALDVPASIKKVHQSSFETGFEKALDEIGRSNSSVLLLTSGDPGYFGPIRRLREKFPNTQLIISPAPSSVAVAAARLGINHEDATVISLVRKDPGGGLDLIQQLVEVGCEKLFVLTPSAASVFDALQILAASHLHPYKVDIFTDLGFESECHLSGKIQNATVPKFTLPEATYCILVCQALSNTTQYNQSNQSNLTPSHKFLQNNFYPAAATKATKRPTYTARGTMYTKPEIRDIIIAKISPWNLPHEATIWDLGAGSGAVGLDIALIRPDIKLIAVDKDPSAVQLIQQNAKELKLDVQTICANALDVIGSLPEPSAIFVGGGSIEVLNQVVGRFGSSVRIVATSVTLEGAAKYRQLLKNQVMVQIYATSALGISGNRLDGYNPIFISWTDTDNYV